MLRKAFAGCGQIVHVKAEAPPLEAFWYFCHCCLNPPEISSWPWTVIRIKGFALMHGLHLGMEIISHTGYKHDFQVRAWVNHNIGGLCGINVVEGDGGAVRTDQGPERASL